MTELEALSPELFAKCDDTLGDTITYVTATGAILSIAATVDYGDGRRDIGAGHMVDQEMMIEIRKSLLPAAPSSAVRMQLPKRPGQTYRPGTVKTDETGHYWLIVPKLVN
jgi:ribosomal protein S5